MKDKLKAIYRLLTSKGWYLMTTDEVEVKASGKISPAQLHTGIYMAIHHHSESVAHLRAEYHIEQQIKEILK